MSTDPQTPPQDDDAIIGQALRYSLLFLAIVGVLVAAVLVLRKGRPAAPETALEPQAPVAVAASVEPPKMPFQDITSEVGIDFLHQSGATGEKLLPETMGSGAAFFDADRDGDPDLFLPNGDHWPDSDRASATSAYYENLGGGSFRDGSVAAGLDLRLYGTGVAVGDFDGDGWLDLFVAAVGSNRLLRNRGGRFEDVTARAGVAGGGDTWSTSAGFFDADRDGDLDLFVGNYVQWSRQIDRQLDYRLVGVGRAYGPPVNYRGTFSYLYRNNGDGTFSDISQAAGLHIENPSTGVAVGKALGLAPIDIDRDGHLDVLVANDTVRNFFFQNRGDGTFEELGELLGVAYGRSGEATGAMGIDAAHYRNDADIGFVIGNFANEMSSLYVTQGDPQLLADEAIGDGIGAPSRKALSFGTLFLDIDLDGRLDMLQVNGHLENEIATVEPSQSYEQPAQLFWNAGPEAQQTFTLVGTETTGDLGQPLVGRGSSYADIDGDGDLDLVITQTGRRPALLRNDQDTGHAWLRIRLADPDSANRHAVGAWVELTAGGVIQRRQVMPTKSYQSQSELPLTFGLGTTEQVDALRVLWPDGSEESFEPPATRQSITLSRGGS